MEIANQFPQFKFEPSDVFMWQPSDRTIAFDPKRVATDKGKIQLLHEVGHALLNHQSLPDESRYQNERAAWEVARTLADKLGLRRQELLIARQLQELKALGY